MIVAPDEYSEHGAHHAVWVLKAGDIGAPFHIPVCANRTVHMAGRFGGGSASLLGRNVAGADGVELATAKRPALIRVQEAPVEVFPTVLGGADDTEVIVHLVCRKNA